ncbi:zinc finger MYND domain-containing protein [Phanerochaete sordida]|uniref:Zinc finger MYND domain-containing protein n=1 Tax=Phanerochaete sordida TaxID=48140 RepID=A0A9P3GF90_9APHY|nr:zinc finger MYND domain-containing protein [Phanerochaete sordida]
MNPWDADGFLVPPSRMTKALLANHARRPDKREDADDNHVALFETLRVLDTAAWHTLLETRFVDALFKVAADRHFCGFTKQELAFFTEKRFVQTYTDVVMGYYIDIIEMLSTSIDFLTRHVQEPCTSSSCGSKLTLAIKSVLRNHPAIWKAVWEIRTPFLDGQPESGFMPPAVLVNTALLSLATRIGDLEITLEQIGMRVGVPAPSFLPHVLLIIWMTAPHAENRTEAVQEMLATFDRNHIAQGGYDAWGKLYTEAVAGYKGLAPLQQCLLRDFKAPDLSAAMLNAALQVLVWLRPHEDDATHMGMDTAIERRMFFHFLAAFRRQECTPGGREEMWYGMNLEMSCQYVMSVLHEAKPRATLPESAMHAMILVVSRAVFPAIERVKDEHDSRFPERVVSAMNHCSSGLLELRDRQGSSSSQNPRMQAMRRHTASVWKSTMDSMHARALHKSQKWRPMVQSWTALGKALEVEKHLVPAPADAELPFAPLERCGWRECLCSVHRPTHGLKVCLGCWQVAYCNAECQEKDWLSGHSRRCLRMRTPTNRPRPRAPQQPSGLPPGAPPGFPTGLPGFTPDFPADFPAGFPADLLARLSGFGL